MENKLGAIPLASLQESEELFRRTFEEATAGICLTGTGGEFLRVNMTLCSMLGYTENELTSLKFNDITYYEDKEIGLSYLKEMINGKIEKACFEKRYVSKNGEILWGHVSVALVSKNPGTRLYFITHIQDITKSKEAERALKESEQRYSATLEAVNDGIWDWDIPSGNAFFSTLYYNMLGYQKDEFPATYPAWRTLVHPEDIEEVEKNLMLSLNSGTGFGLELRMKMKDGRWLWVLTRGKVIERDSLGKVIRMVGTLSDITERKNAELLLQKYTEDLRISNATKDKFISVLAHDLRGPFSGFMGITEDLAKNIDLMEKYEISEYANAMHATSHRIYQLLTNLLEWSSLQTGKVELLPQNLELFNEVSAVQDLFSSAAANKSIALNNEIDRNARILIDPYSLTTILRNLISNSVKFTCPGGKIKISSVKSKDMIEMAVADTGIGMDKETLEKVFRIDSGFTTRGTKGEAGTGLGLVLCKELIEKNGGELVVNSTPGEGTKITFRLPQPE